ncbi:MAG: hypothetical protein ACXAC7_10405 [Candidatus Hodarchaeales archaeon]|jgi:DNA repair exonuclease SbcCD ATPase subunit
MVKIKDEDIDKHFKKISEIEKSFKKLPDTIEQKTKDQSKNLMKKIQDDATSSNKELMETVTKELNSVKKDFVESLNQYKNESKDYFKKIEELITQQTVAIQENQKNISELGNFQAQANEKLQSSSQDQGAGTLKQIEDFNKSLSDMNKEISTLLENTTIIDEKLVQMLPMQSYVETLIQKLPEFEKSIETVQNKLKHVNISQQTTIQSVGDNAEKTILGMHQQFETFEEKVREGVIEYFSSILPRITTDLIAKFETLIVEVSRLRDQSISGEELKSLVTDKFQEVTSHQSEVIEKSRTEAMKASQRTRIPVADQFGRDSDEIRSLIQFFKRSPTSKAECIAEVERVRDEIMFERDVEAPYRVTASKIFREVISEIQREDREIQRTTNRSVIHNLDKLLDHIMAQ